MLKRSVFFLIAVALLSAHFASAPAAASSAAPDAAIPATIVPDALADVRRLAGSGDFAGAIAQLAKYVAAHPEDGEATRYLGDLYVRTGDLKLAERTYLAELTTAPHDRATHDRLGNAYAADDLVPQAIEHYQLSLPDVVAYMDLVRLHRHIGDLPAFVAGYRLRALNPTDFTAQLGFGAILQSLHRPSEATPFLQRAVTLAPHSCAARTELGNAELDLDQSERAAADFRECLAIDPKDYGATVDLSLTFDPKRDAAAASALLDRALELQPYRPEAMVDYGYLDDVLGKRDAAIGFYRRALAADVLTRDAYVDLGYDYQQQRMFTLAEAVFLKGLSVSPGDGRIEYLLGQTYVEQGKRTLAIEQFSAAAGSDEPDVSRAASAALTAR